MKVAVCISGACVSKNSNTNLQKNLSRVKQFFPDYDYHFATWSGFQRAFENNFPEETAHYYPEPDIGYHPYFDIPEEHWESNRFAEARDFIQKGGLVRREWTSHHTKQHLIHAWLCDKIKDDYDIVVRARFDTWIFKDADFIPYVMDTYENNRINSFSAKRKNFFDVLSPLDTQLGGKYHNWIVDQLIMHPMSFIDRAYVDRLHEEQRLHPAEMGWYQILSKPNGSTHRCFDGWVNHDKNVLERFFR